MLFVFNPFHLKLRHTYYQILIIQVTSVYVHYGSLCKRNTATISFDYLDMSSALQPAQFYYFICSSVSPFSIILYCIKYCSQNPPLECESPCSIPYIRTDRIIATTGSIELLLQQARLLNPTTVIWIK